MKHFKIYLSALFLVLCTLSCNRNKESKDVKSTYDSTQFDIEWKDLSQENFTFAKEWDYPEGVYKNQFGQLSCDGICLPETDQMKDEDGKIYEDSLQAFYKLVDTTHIYSKMQSKGTAIEFVDSPQITVKRIDKDTIEAFTNLSSATHSLLKIKIINDRYFVPTVELISVRNEDKLIYPCVEGTLEMDKTYWEKGIMKANFSFLFFDEQHPDKPIEWKGKILSEIK